MVSGFDITGARCLLASYWLDSRYITLSVHILIVSICYILKEANGQGLDIFAELPVKSIAIFLRFSFYKVFDADI